MRRPRPATPSAAARCCEESGRYNVSARETARSRDGDAFKFGANRSWCVSSIRRREEEEGAAAGEWRTHRLRGGGIGVEIRSVYMEMCVKDFRIICGNKTKEVDALTADFISRPSGACCGTLREPLECEGRITIHYASPDGDAKDGNWTACDAPTSAAPNGTDLTSAAPNGTDLTSAAPNGTDLTSAAPPNATASIAVGLAAVVILAGIVASIIYWKRREIWDRFRNIRLCRGGDPAAPPDVELQPMNGSAANGQKTDGRQVSNGRCNGAGSVM